ncbi:heterokaryon incompatibility protein-domain-containing protein [Xylaria telfairii]|nr:heterokaryon incompatibility protein-domain-containing protein [Xylaria telfairii]
MRRTVLPRLEYLLIQASVLKAAMLCNRCETVNFQPLLARDQKSGFYILHHSQASYSHALAKRCALCTLISSQLGDVELKDDVCDQLEAFMVLKRRWPPASDSVAGANMLPVSIHSRLGFATLSVIDTLPMQYRESNCEDRPSYNNRKRKRGQIEATSSSKIVCSEHGNRLEDPSSQLPSPHHTGSHENMRLARHWVKDCLEHHDMCARGSSHHQGKFVPKRLVDTQDPNRPFLLAATDGMSNAKYIALSYAWGNGRERFTTTKTNFKDYQNGIPVKLAPRTFIHAFQVTRELGYRYIWMDQLCIIQDDYDDLEREMAKMGEIYRHATFTIFAEGASSVSGGLFQARDQYLYQPCAVDVKITTEKGVVTEQLTLGTIITGENYLKKRGWVLQEEILSSRCLSFGKQMSWRCTASEASETRPVPRPRRTALSDGRATCEDKLKLWLYAPAQMRDAPREKWFRWNQYDSWYSVMEEYSIKNLTQVTDHLKAVSGLAELFRRAHHTTYAAGLWREDLQLGLAWYVASNDSRSVKAAGDQKPSWSWVSVGLVRLKFRTWASFATHVVSEGAEVLGVFCRPVHEANPTGAVIDGVLELRARVKKLRLSWSAEYVVNRTEFSYGSYSGAETTTMTRGEHPRFPARVYDLGSSHFVGEAALDRAMHTRPGAGTGDVDVWCALLHVQKTSDNLRFTALVLEEDRSKEMTYRRLGLLFLDDKQVKDTSLSDWDSKEIHIL